MKIACLRVAALALAVSFGTAAESQPNPKLPSLVQRMLDGSVRAGVSPETSGVLYTTPEDAPGKYTWNASMYYCHELEADGHNDWRVPTKGELNVLFANRAAIGGFNENLSDNAHWYPSSAEANSDYAWMQRFSDGLETVIHKHSNLSLRCVRG